MPLVAKVASFGRHVGIATTSAAFEILNCRLLQCVWLQNLLHLNDNRIHVCVGVVWEQCIHVVISGIV